MTNKPSSYINNENICRKNLLLVEGKDEKLFYSRLTKILGFEHIQIIDVGGKDQFKSGLKMLELATAYDSVTSLGIIRDAETDVNSTFNSINNALISIGLTPPKKPGEFLESDKKVGVFIQPDNKNIGCLETILYEYIRSNKPDRYQCIEEFIGYADASWENPNTEWKSKIHAYLSTLREPDKRLGESAQAKFWDDAFNSDTFSDLVSFVKQVAK